MSTAPGVDERTDLRTDEDTDTGHGEVAHIVRSGGGDAAARVLEARITGTPLEALCGAVFTPQRDPKRLPLCGRCKEIYELYRMGNEGLPDEPDA